MSTDALFKVLVVEDQALLAMELEYVLRELGHDVIGCAMDAEEAMAMAGATVPDVALVDMNLRDGPSGRDIAQSLNQTYGTVAVFLTANPEQIPSCFAGALGVLVKPFESQTLRDVLIFAGQFARDGTIGEIPQRFRLAPWVLEAPPAMGEV